MRRRGGRVVDKGNGYVVGASISSRHVESRAASAKSRRTLGRDRVISSEFTVGIEEIDTIKDS
jgi:hypothetical protein